jgi:hypothetical protein
MVHRPEGGWSCRAVALCTVVEMQWSCSAVELQRSRSGTAVELRSLSGEATKLLHKTDLSIHDKIDDLQSGFEPQTMVW